MTETLPENFELWTTLSFCWQPFNSKRNSDEHRKIDGGFRFFVTDAVKRLNAGQNTEMQNRCQVVKKILHFGTVKVKIPIYFLKHQWCLDTFSGVTTFVFVHTKFYEMEKMWK